MVDSGNLNPSQPPPPQTPFYNNRVLGGFLLLAGAILCLLMVLTLDAAIFVPFNATHAVTQTWQAENPPTPTDMEIDTF